MLFGLPGGRPAFGDLDRPRAAPGRPSIPRLILALPRSWVILATLAMLIAGCAGRPVGGADRGGSRRVVSFAPGHAERHRLGLPPAHRSAVQPGDWIKADEIEGRVVDINWRTSGSRTATSTWSSFPTGCVRGDDHQLRPSPPGGTAWSCRCTDRASPPPTLPARCCSPPPIHAGAGRSGAVRVGGPDRICSATRPTCGSTTTNRPGAGPTSVSRLVSVVSPRRAAPRPCARPSLSSTRPSTTVESQITTADVPPSGSRFSAHGRSRRGRPRPLASTAFGGPVSARRTIVSAVSAPSYWLPPLIGLVSVLRRNGVDDLDVLDIEAGEVFRRSWTWRDEPAGP